MTRRIRQCVHFHSQLRSRSRECAWPFGGSAFELGCGEENPSHRKFTSADRLSAEKSLISAEICFEIAERSTLQGAITSQGAEKIVKKMDINNRSISLRPTSQVVQYYLSLEGLDDLSNEAVRDSRLDSLGGVEGVLELGQRLHDLIIFGLFQQFTTSRVRSSLSVKLTTGKRT